MKSKSYFFLFLTASFFPLLLSQNVYACQCLGLPTPYEAFQEADAVFVGKIIEVKDSQGKVISKDKSATWEDYRQNEGNTEYNRFSVSEWFKGEKTSEAVVATRINMCENGFFSNESSLVYAYKSGSSSNLETSLFCSRNYYNKTDTYFLRDILANKPEPRIYGAVKLRDKNLNDDAQEKFLENVKIIAQSGKKKFFTVTDKNGLYRFLKLPDGKYKVFPALQNKYRQILSFDSIEEVTLQSEREYPAEYFQTKGPSAFVDITVGFNNNVTGRVLDAKGKELEKATIRLLPRNQIKDEPLDDERHPGFYNSSENKDKTKRKFILINNSPGEYVLALEVFAPFSSGREKLRMYYPQAFTPEKAQSIILGEATPKNFDFRLPKGFIVHEIEGTIVSASNEMKTDGWISIEKMENSDDKNNVIYDSQPTKNGKFRFQVFENAVYWVHASFGNKKAKPIKIKVGKTNRSIKLTLTLISDSNQNNP